MPPVEAIEKLTWGNGDEYNDITTWLKSKMNKLSQPLSPQTFDFDNIPLSEANDCRYMFNGRAYTDVTSHIYMTLNSLAQNHILIPKPTEVSNYLLNNNDLVGVLSIACYKALERFKNKAQLSLELYKDPEIEDEYLTLYIRQEEYDDNIMDEIKDIRGTFSRQLKGKACWLFVTTDFLPPR